MLTHSQKRVVLDELNHIRTGYTDFRKLARKRVPETPAVIKARAAIRRLEKLVQHYDDRVERFRKTKEETARKLRAAVRHSIEFDDAKVVQKHMNAYVKFMADA